MHRIKPHIIVVINNLIAFIIFFNPLLKASPNGEYSSLAFQTLLVYIPNLQRSNIHIYPVL